MFDRLKEIESRYEALGERINDPAVIAAQGEWRELMKEHAALAPIVEKYREHRAAKKSFEELRAMLDESLDEDMRDLVKEEFAETRARLEDIVAELKVMLLPKDPNDDKNVIVEIRGGAGGDEAALFAGDLFRMYIRYAERRRWKNEVMSASESDLGGFKEVVFSITGKGAYSRLKYESGVHRVQRVPETESSGRIHTSTVTVAVLPEVEDVDVDVDPADCKIDVYRSSGNGGQSVNTTDSAVRITHGPTGIVVTCQDEKSQLKNKDKAMKILRAKLYDMELEKVQRQQASERRSQVGSGDRSERIRTYNFPQGRVSDHRVGLTLYRLDAVLDGDMDEVMDVLSAAYRAEQLNAAAPRN